MKKWTAMLILLCVIMAFFLSACSSQSNQTGNVQDEENAVDYSQGETESYDIAESNPFIGKWKYNGSSVECYQDFMAFHKPNTSDRIYIDEISFFNDGTFSGICRGDGYSYRGNYSISGTYSVINDGSALLLNNYENGERGTYQYSFLTVGQLTITGAGPHANTFTYFKEVPENLLMEKTNENEMATIREEDETKDNYSEERWYFNNKICCISYYDEQGRLLREDYETDRIELLKTEVSKSINTSALLSVNGVSKTDCYQVDYYGENGEEENEQRVFFAFGYNSSGKMVVHQCLFFLNQSVPYVTYQINYELNDNGDPTRSVKTSANGDVVWAREYNNTYSGNRLVSSDITTTIYAYDDQSGEEIGESVEYEDYHIEYIY